MRKLVTLIAVVFVLSAVYNGDPQFFKDTIASAWYGISDISGELIAELKGPRLDVESETAQPTIPANQGGWGSPFYVSSGQAIKKVGTFSSESLIASDSEMVLTMLLVQGDSEDDIPVFAGAVRSGDDWQAALWIPSGDSFARKTFSSARTISGMLIDDNGTVRVSGQTRGGRYYEGTLNGV